MSRLKSLLTDLPANRTYLSMRELPAAYQKITGGQRKLSQRTFRRWMRDGVRGEKLRRVVTDTTYTRLDWLFDFIERCERSEWGGSRNEFRGARGDERPAVVSMALDKAGVRNRDQAERECLAEGIA